MRALLASRGVSPEIQEVALLLISEVGTNALIHGTPPVVVLGQIIGERLHVAVHDSSDREPHLSRGRHRRDGGLGLRLVDSLADGWGVDWRPPGKDVWFDMDLSSPARTPGA